MTESNLPPVKLLLVDDLDENLIVLEALLRRSDVELLSAQSGREALELLLVHDVALALVDVQMPEMDGFELAELMRGSERTRNVPIIFVTAGSREQQRIFRGYDAGAVDFLFKPIDPPILQHKVAIFHQLYRQKQQLAAQLEELRAAHEERERLTQELQETLRLNEMFIGAVSHDLRNPLNAILTASDLLGRQVDPSLTRIVDRLRGSGRRMARMIEDLLDLTRARLGDGIPIQRGAADLLALTQRVIAEQQVATPELRVDLEERGDLSGDWDGDRLEQVISNLVGNAAKHGRAGTPVRVVLDGQRPDVVTIAVRNGGEIAPDLLPQLFNPFRSGDKGRSRAAGLGLGLYIVQQIVGGHGGRVTASSAPVEGVEFRIELPRRGPLPGQPGQAGQGGQAGQVVP